MPKLAERELPGTLAKLRAKSPFKIIVYGDSISGGGCPSLMAGVPPYLPPWADLIHQELLASYHGPIIMKNRSLGGETASWGDHNASSLVAPEKPDLCLIGFGMNDRAFKVSTADFMKSMQAIMAAVRKENPNAEFILISSILNNPIQGITQPLWDYRAEMLKLQGPGIAIADMTAVDQALLKKKPYVDMSGNNVNHPNDYLARWYAQVISSLLVPSLESKPNTP